MIIDNIENIKNYGVLSDDYVEKILSFIKRVGLEGLKDGKYPLDGDSLFGLVQSYLTREKDTCKMEAHKKYIDLQYIVDGSEMMYCDFTDALTEFEPFKDESDIGFYESKEEKVSILLEKGMFVFLLPSDAHMPCCSVHKKSQVKKIVFKIQNNIK
jgi:uncharacterized protein, YhcH/YjgK/YiaL family